MCRAASGAICVARRWLSRQCATLLSCRAPACSHMDAGGNGRQHEHDFQERRPRLARAVQGTPACGCSHHTRAALGLPLIPSAPAVCSTPSCLSAAGPATLLHAMRRHMLAHDLTCRRGSCYGATRSAWSSWPRRGARRTSRSGGLAWQGRRGQRGRGRRIPIGLPVSCQ